MREAANPVVQRQEKIFDAIKNRCRDKEGILLVISGDVANAGKMEEYYQAMSFLDFIKKEIKAYTGLDTMLFAVPGNHDCDHTPGENEDIRNMLIRNMEKGETVIDQGKVKLCCKAQADWFEFCRAYMQQEARFHDELLTVQECQIDSCRIQISCYNTAWASQFEERQGLMFFPYDWYNKIDVFKNIPPLSISILHHPFNWQNIALLRAFRNHIELTSHIVFSGHEHVQDQRRNGNLEDDPIIYVEGAILQHKGQPEKSGFNLVEIDLAEQKLQVHNYLWNGSIYETTNSSNMVPYGRHIARNDDGFTLRPGFTQKYLNELGAAIRHRRKEKVEIDDIFVFPDLRDLKRVSEDPNKTVIRDTISARVLLNTNEKDNKTILVGNDRSGKTTLCKILFRHYFADRYIPVLLNGALISSPSMKDFVALLEQKFNEQYEQKTPETFRQLSEDRLFIMLDDFNKVRLNIKNKGNFLQNLDLRYKNILLISDELFELESFMLDKEQKEAFAKKYRTLQMRAFGHVLRGELIDKWNRLGSKPFHSENDIHRDNDHAAGIIDSIVRRNYVPAYPVFLLTILQAIEAGRSHNLEQSTYGHYYGYLITEAFDSLKMSPDEMNTYLTYLTELAYSLFMKKTSAITNSDLSAFHVWYCKEYTITLAKLGLDTVMGKLEAADLLTSIDDTVSFRYDYVYYYFVARYLATNIHEAPIKELIADLCANLNIEEYSNVIMFLTHHSRDPFIIEQIISNAKAIFRDVEMVKMENDISVINDLIDELPKLVLEDVDVAKYRKDKLRKADHDDQEQEPSAEPSQGSLNGSEREVSEINLAWKHTELMGQILKNYWGALKTGPKIGLAEQAYNLSLRGLNSFYQYMRVNVPKIIDHIKAKMPEKDLGSVSRIETLSRRLFFHLCTMVSHSFIDKFAELMGSEHLIDTYVKLLEMNDTVAVRTMDIAMKLKFEKGFPLSDVKLLMPKIENNFLALSLLRRIVIDYIYMFETTAKERQRICNVLGIPISVQIMITQYAQEQEAVEVEQE
jgi:hypothetical protein